MGLGARLPQAPRQRAHADGRKEPSDSRSPRGVRLLDGRRQVRHVRRHGLMHAHDTSVYKLYHVRFFPMVEIRDRNNG